MFSNQASDTTGAIYWIIYIIAIIMSFVGILISSKIRHDREVERFRKSIIIASRDPSAVWPGMEQEGQQ
ncbi:MAG: hypothetical protein ACP5KW_00410 [Thermoproteota archaeon]|jgi:uncharacterized membrane protein YfcA